MVCRPHLKYRRRNISDKEKRRNRQSGTHTLELQVPHSVCNDIFNHTSLCEFYQGRLMLHMTIPFKEKPKSNLPGDNLRYYRLRKQLTTRQLAEQIDVVPATILMYEQNRHPICIWNPRDKCVLSSPPIMIRGGARNSRHRSGGSRTCDMIRKRIAIIVPRTGNCR